MFIICRFWQITSECDCLRWSLFYVTLLLEVFVNPIVESTMVLGPLLELSKSSLFDLFLTSSVFFLSLHKGEKHIGIYTSNWWSLHWLPQVRWNSIRDTYLDSFLFLFFWNRITSSIPLISQSFLNGSIFFIDHSVAFIWCVFDKS